MSHHISGNVIVPHRHSAARHDLLSQQEAKLSRLQHTKACTTISQSCHHVTAVLHTLLIIGGVEMNPGPNTTPETPNSPRFYSVCTSPELWRTPSNNQPSPSASLPWLRDRRSSSFSRSITGNHRGSHPSARSSLESNICFSDAVSSPVTPTTSPRVTDVTHRPTTTMAHDANRNLQLFDPLHVQNPVASTFSSVSPSMVPTAAPRHNGWAYLSSADHRTVPTHVSTVVTSSTISTGTSRINTAPTVNRTPSTNINQLISSITSRFFSVMRQGNARNPIDNTTSFLANPFYEPVTELLQLTALENGKRSSICTDSLCEMQRNMSIQNISNFNCYYACFQFKLDLNSEIFQVNSKQMVQLRFCRLTAGTTGLFEDHLPSGLQINLNNKNMILPLPHIPHGEFCIPAQPINLKTHYLKIGETSQHLVVTWRHESNDGTTVRNYANSVRYAIAVNIVKKLEPEEAVSRLSCIWSRERTESKIREQLQASALNEVAATTLRISLICPLSMVRIKTPVRFQSCRHLQCVDALALLRKNELSYGWRCPICNAISSYYKLHVDQYFADVLSSPLLPSTCSEIELQENGSWKPCYDPKNCSADQTPNKCDMNQSVLVTYEKHEKPAPSTRMNNTNLLIEKNLKELITNRLSLISSQDSQEQVQTEEDPYNSTLYLSISDEGMETTAPDNHEQELEPMVYNCISNSSTNQLSNISSIALDSELNCQTTPEKVQEPTTTVQSSDVTETTGVNIQDEVELPLSNELSFLVESFDASSTENIPQLQNETDLSETSTRTVDTNEHSFLEDAAENVHELTNETELAETSTQTVDISEPSFDVESTENIHDLTNEGAPVQTKQPGVTKTVEKASRTTKTTTKKQVTKKKPLSVVPTKKTNRKANKIVTFVISSDDSEDDDPRDPTHKQKTTNLNSSQDDAPHRPFTRSQARRAAGKKN